MPHYRAQRSSPLPHNKAQFESTVLAWPSMAYSCNSLGEIRHTRTRFFFFCVTKHNEAIPWLRELTPSALMIGLCSRAINEARIHDDPHSTQQSVFIFQPKQTKIPYDYFFVTPVFGFIQNSRSQALFIFNFWGGGSVFGLGQKHL